MLVVSEIVAPIKKHAGSQALISSRISSNMRSVPTLKYLLSKGGTNHIRAETARTFEIWGNHCVVLAFKRAWFQKQIENIRTYRTTPRIIAEAARATDLQTSIIPEIVAAEMWKAGCEIVSL